MPAPPPQGAGAPAALAPHPASGGVGHGDKRAVVADAPEPRAVQERRVAAVLAELEALRARSGWQYTLSLVDPRGGARAVTPSCLAHAPPHGAVEAPAAVHAQLMLPSPLGGSVPSQGQKQQEQQQEQQQPPQPQQEQQQEQKQQPQQQQEQQQQPGRSRPRKRSRGAGAHEKETDAAPQGSKDGGAKKQRADGPVPGGMVFV